MLIYQNKKFLKSPFKSEEELEQVGAKEQVARYDVNLSDLIEAEILSVGEKLFMDYKPRNGEKKKYTAIVEEDGSLSVLGQQFSSPSYAALAGIQNAGSERPTANGWVSWKNKKGKTLAELREIFLISNTK